MKSLTASELIALLRQDIDEYPEYADTELRGVNEFGEEFYIVSTDLAGDLWIIVDEVVERTGECACGAKCDHGPPITLWQRIRGMFR